MVRRRRSRLRAFAVDMVLAQAYDGFEPEPDEPPATSEALVRLLNTHEVGVDLPGDLWPGRAGSADQ